MICEWISSLMDKIFSSLIDLRSTCRSHKTGDALREMLGSFLIIDKTHEPEILPVNCHNLYVLLLWVFSHLHRIHRPNLSQWYHYLFNSIQFQYFLFSLVYIRLIMVIYELKLRLGFLTRLPCNSSMSAGQKVQ